MERDKAKLKERADRLRRELSQLLDEIEEEVCIIRTEYNVEENYFVKYFDDLVTVSKDDLFYLYYFIEEAISLIEGNANEDNK